MPSKAIFPPSSGFRSRNIELSPVMCNNDYGIDSKQIKLGNYVVQD